MKITEINKLRSLVKDNYETIATDFDLTRKTALWPTAKEYCQNISAGQKVLDLGCGNGRLFAEFKNRSIVYLGIDNSSTLIELAKKNFPEGKFMVGDILDLNKIISREEKYDYIFCLATLQHIPGRKLRIELLKNIKDQLAPNGEVIISNWNLWSSKHKKLIFKFALLKILGRNKLDFKDIIFSWKSNQGEALSDRYYHAFSGRELKKLAMVAGFKTIQLKKDQYNYWLYLKS